MAIETLRDALWTMGVTYYFPGGAGRYQLRSLATSKLGPPVDAVSAWQFVKLVRAGAYVSVRTVELAIEKAAAELP